MNGINGLVVRLSDEADSINAQLAKIEKGKGALVLLAVKVGG